MAISRQLISRRTYALAFAVVLSPASLQFGSGRGGGGFEYSCTRSSNTNLSTLELIVGGEDQIAFDPSQLAYDVWLPLSTDSALVRAVPMDPTTQVFFRVSNDFDSFDIGGSEAVIPLAPGLNIIEVHVIAEDNTRRSDYIMYIRIGCSDCSDGNVCTTDVCDPVLEVCTWSPLPPGADCDFGGGVPGVCINQNCVSVCTASSCDDDHNDCTDDLCDPLDGCYTLVPDGTPCAGGTCSSGTCNVTETTLPCTEQGIRNAIATGGGPYTFDCAGPTTVVTTAEIVIDNDVILDGEGNLTVDAQQTHLAFSLATGTTAELRGFTVTDGSIFASSAPETLTLTNCTVSGGQIVGSHMILDNITVSGGGILGSSITLTNSTVSGTDGNGIHTVWDGRYLHGGPVMVTNSIVSGSGGHGVYNAGNLVMTNSTVSGNTLYGIYGAEGTMTVTNSTISGSGYSAIFAHGGIGHEAGVHIAGTLIDGFCAPWEDPVWVSSGDNVESPGNTCRFDHATDRFDVTAAELNLGPLQDNGGPTETHALLPGSVAIDVIPETECVDAEGEPLTTDQRGEPRDSMCDVGAFEVQP